MRNPKLIIEETQLELHKDGCQSTNVLNIVCIEKAQKEMFQYLYDEAEKEENKNLTLSEFFDKLDGKLLFNS